jgi:RNA polymerase sigma-70 factor (ECF subfamily)
VTPDQARDDLDHALDGARRGDEAAFTVLYRALHPRILRYAAALVGADADDVAAEAWLQVARDLHRFTGDADAFRAWISTITRNRATDLHRARARRPVVLDDVLALADRPARDDTAEDAVQRLATARAVALVASLPREQAEAVLLRTVVGLDVAATARVLGKRPGAVRVAAHRGLKRLAAELAGRGRAGHQGSNDNPNDNPNDSPDDDPDDDPDNPRDDDPDCEVR